MGFANGAGGVRTGIACMLVFGAWLAQPVLPGAEPASPDQLRELGVSTWRLSQIDRVVEQGLSRGDFPGAVLLVRYRGVDLWRKAYGQRQVEPTPEPLTVDTIFDLASITKPVATATAIHLLLQEGQLTLDDPVTRWLPDFGQNGKEAVTVRHLLTHTSGLIPDNALADYLQGPAKAFENIHALPLRTPAGSRFAYSDVGFLVLGELVEKVSGQSLADFTRARLFLPCGMHDTAFNPPADWRPRIAPTHKREDNWIRGEVHDPRAYALGGTAGHAGLFSTADDLARFGQMLIQQGELDGQRILEPATVTAMFQTERVSSGLRALGWDKDSPYSSNRGDLLSQAAIGHGGFTGTVFWIDPEQQLVLVFLASRLHPKGEGNVNALAGRVFTIAAAALPAPSTP